jgi:tetratricopeptide (TPR) repeat protein
MDAAALLQDGLDHHRAGRLAQAERCYRAALAVQPDQPDGLHLLGLLGATAGDAAAAARCIATAASLRPEEARYWGDLGACLYQLARMEDAEAALRRALALAPDRAPPLDCLGLVLAARGDAAGAEGAYRAALRLQPDAPGTRTNLGNLLREQGRLDEAIVELRAALALRPGAPDALHNLAVALAAAGELVEAEALCRAALARDPAHADAHYTLGTTLLLGGRLREGFSEFRWRWRRRGFAPPRAFAQPAWRGEALSGRTLLLHAEHGLGDAIQMLRFVRTVATLGRVVLEVPAPLVRLAEPLAPTVARGAAPPAFDVHCSLMDLAGVLNVDLDSIPTAVPYLAPPEAAVAAWRKDLATVPGLRVGLAWAGNPRYPADARRSLPPAWLAGLADLPAMSFVSLQKDAAASPPLALLDRTAALHDLAETAALIANLDLVVAVDSAVAHLAGALGRPVWLLNRFDTCWRWLRERADSPWYPSMRIFRQARPGDWEGVMAEVRAALNARM